MKEMEDAMRALDTERRFTLASQVTDLLREVTRLQDRISEALRIHRNRASSIYRHGICVECSKGAVRGSVEYPCQTAQALGVTKEWLDEQAGR
jgi:predicted XRE-type DNA-binding protein